MSVPTSFPTSVPATIMIPPMDRTVVSPNPAVFTCEADGVSTPVITWWRRESSNSLTQLSSDGINVTISEENLDSRTVQSNLTILQSQPVDAVEYVCRATNEIGSNTASAVLTVYGMYNFCTATLIYAYVQILLAISGTLLPLCLQWSQHSCSHLRTSMKL